MICQNINNNKNKMFKCIQVIMGENASAGNDIDNDRRTTIINHIHYKL